MKTFNKKLKAQILTTANQHQEFDRFVQGAWLQEEKKGEMFRGCFFGCMTQTENNTLEKAHEEMRIPLWLIHLSENIFEGLPEKEAVLFPVQLLEAIPINRNLEKVYKSFFYKLLMDKEMGQITFVKKDSEQYKAIKQCGDLFLMKTITEKAANSAVNSANSAAYSAASSAANSASNSAYSVSCAYSAARWAASSAADSAADSVSWAYSAYSARWAYSAYSARSEHYQWMRGILIEALTKLNN